eukprot:6478475-Amphidinium_carterae.2
MALPPARACMPPSGRTSGFIPALAASPSTRLRRTNRGRLPKLTTMPGKAINWLTFTRAECLRQASERAQISSTLPFGRSEPRA